MGNGGSMTKRWLFGLGLLCVTGCAGLENALLPVLVEPTAGKGKPADGEASASPNANASAKPNTRPSALPSRPPAPGTNIALDGQTPPFAPGPTTERATADRPDDSPLPQTHVVYFVPADTPDDHLDTNGSITGTLALARTWMESQADGSYVRTDLYQGKPDVTFFRSSSTAAELGTNSSAILKNVKAELQQAGFMAPHKTYVAYYAADLGTDREDPSTTGKSSGAYAVITFNQCNPCSGEVYRRGMSLKTGLTYVHETLHSWGFVPDCAPHHAGSHVADDEDDLMSAGGVSRYLDRGHDDYYKTGRDGCLDLARSPLMEPLPADVLPPIDIPLQLAPGDAPVAVSLKAARGGTEVELDALTIGDGPANTYTLAFTIRHGKGANRFGHVVVDDERQRQPYSFADDEPQVVYASIPRKGKHPVSLGSGPEANGTEYHQHEFIVDGDAPKEKAVTVKF